VFEQESQKRPAPRWQDGEPLPPPGPFGVLNPTYRIKRRQQRIRAEIERARNGDHKVPTWVLGLILVAIVGAWLGLIFLS
jgi:hypothetical protein